MNSSAAKVSPATHQSRASQTFLWWTRRILGGLVGLIIMFGVAGAVYQAVGAALDARKYPPPGRLVDVGGYRLHINCTGEGSPTVILETGGGAWSLE
jgi:hypothetical protein